MMKLFYPAIVVLILSAYSCADLKEGMKAAAAARDAVQATSFNLSMGTENGKSYNKITLTGGLMLNNPDLGDQTLASIAVMNYFANVPSEKLKDLDVITIGLERKGITTEQEFPVSDLHLADESIREVKEADSLLANGHYREFFDRLDTAMQAAHGSPDSLQIVFGKIFNELGPVKERYFSGFLRANVSDNGGPDHEYLKVFITQKRNQDLIMRYAIDITPGRSVIHAVKAEYYQENNK